MFAARRVGAAELRLPLPEPDQGARERYGDERGGTPATEPVYGASWPPLEGAREAHAGARGAGQDPQSEFIFVM